MSYPGYPGYPSANPTYPMSGQPQPQSGGYPYPGTTGYPGASPYPSSTYPSATSTYPSGPVTTYPGSTPSYPGGTTYPGTVPAPSYPSYPSGPGSAPSPYGAQPTYPGAPHVGYPPQTVHGSYPTGMPQQYPPTMGGVPTTTGMYGAVNPPPYGAPMPQQNTYPGMMPGTGSMQPSYMPPLHAGTAPAAPHSQSYPSHTTANLNQGTPTVKPAHPFDPNHDCQLLKKAMKGFGTDERTVISVLTKRSNAQRQQIALTYKTMFGKDLTSQLRSELGGRLEDVILALMMPHYEYMASQLNKAVKGLGTKEITLIEILCSNTNSEIKEINAAYQRSFGRTLEKDVSDDTSGYFRRLLIGLCTANRNETQHVDQARAAQDAQVLYKAGAGKLGTDESTFQSILVTQSYPQLQMVFHEYERQTGKSIERALQSEMCGDLLDGMLAIVKCVRSRPAFFAERLQKSIQGMGTNDNTLIRVIVTRCEIDMVEIKHEFAKNYQKSLETRISSDTSGDYKKILLGLIE